MDCLLAFWPTPLLFRLLVLPSLKHFWGKCVYTMLVNSEANQSFIAKIFGKTWMRWVIIVFALGVIVASITPVYAFSSTKKSIYSLSSAPSRDVAIIFGAGLEAPGKPSNFLQSRLLTGAQLYKSGRAKVLVVSGDNRKANYDEPTAMRDFLVKQGIPRQAIVLDYAGFNTYDTCNRAKRIFSIQAATLVTHGYHLPRALMTCNAAGVQSIGVRADRSPAFPRNYIAREYLSLNKAGLEIMLHLEPTVLGRQEPAVQQALGSYQ